MKYSSQIIINRNINAICKLIEDPESSLEWMPGLEEMEHIAGEPGKQGSVTQLHFKRKGKTFTMQETVLENNLPQLFRAQYDAPNIVNTIRVRMEEVDESKTLYVSETNFVFAGAIKFVAYLLPNMFKKQTKEYLNSLKLYAENNIPLN